MPGRRSRRRERRREKKGSKRRGRGGGGGERLRSSESQSRGCSSPPPPWGLCLWSATERVFLECFGLCKARIVEREHKRTAAGWPGPGSPSPVVPATCSVPVLMDKPSRLVFRLKFSSWEDHRAQSTSESFSCCISLLPTTRGD